MRQNREQNQHMVSYFRSDGWVKSATGPAVPGAQIFVCNQPANLPNALSPSAPSPLANIFSDPNGLVPITQPIITDGFGHYNFYVTAGVYTLLVYLSGALQQVYTDQSVGGVGSGSGTALILSTNGVQNGSQTRLNIIGVNHIAASESSGDVTIDGSALAPIASPAFTGTPTAPTPPPGDNSTKIATTAFVDSAIGGAGSLTISVNNALAALNVTTDGTIDWAVIDPNNAGIVDFDTWLFRWKRKGGFLARNIKAFGNSAHVLRTGYNSAVNAPIAVTANAGDESVDIGDSLGTFGTPLTAAHTAGALNPADVNGTDYGWTILAPSKTSNSRLRVYISFPNASGNGTINASAHLWDGSAADVAVALVSPSAPGQNFFEINFKSQISSFLTVNLSGVPNPAGAVLEVDLVAVTLS